jgi:hypothetical protein
MAAEEDQRLTGCPAQEILFVLDEWDYAEERELPHSGRAPPLK